jgi:DNA-binding response OmpR family regulator
VDDEPGILNALRRCFRNEPYVVITASSPDEALGWLGDLPAVDLILVDERMPGTTGTELLKEVRERSPGTLRAMLTGFPSEVLIQKGLEAGAGIFMYKPWDDAQLRDTVRRILFPRRPAPAGDEAPSAFDVGGEGG